MPPTDRERAAHIVDAITRIQTRVHERDVHALEADDQLLDSVLYQFARLGEAASNLSVEAQARHPDIPWKQVKGLRNHVTHEYHKVDVQIIWDTIQQGLPDLLAAMEAELLRTEQTRRRGPTF
jgi:uncharacterized protein with HEPN domain